MQAWKVFGIAGLIITNAAIWSGTAQAQYYNSQINQREAAQEQQIQDGIRSGALTPREAGRLEAEQQRIRDAEARMRADGRLNPQEKVILDRMQNRAQRDIYREKHDRQVAYPEYGKHHKAHYQQEHNPWVQRRLAEQERRGAPGVPCGSNGERGRYPQQQREGRHFGDR